MDAVNSRAVENEGSEKLFAIKSVAGHATVIIMCHFKATLLRPLCILHAVVTEYLNVAFPLRSFLIRRVNLHTG